MSHSFYLSAALIAGSLILDLIFGDPSWIPHPVRLIGALVQAGEENLRTGESRIDLRNGAMLATGVIVVALVVTWLIVAVGDALSPILGAALAVAIAWLTLALKGLEDAAAQVESALARGDDEAARRAMPALVGRDPASLGRLGMVRATVESVAENSCDGVIAPLFFLFVGGPALAMAYKAVNTLDSMIGYESERYFYFGRAAARIDDVANFIPARLAAACLMTAAAVYLGRGTQAYVACSDDARHHPSPNSGFPEAAMAGALGIQLGGDAVYEGNIERRPLLGRAERAPKIEDIATARKLLRFATLVAFCALAIVRLIIVALIAG